MRKLMLFSLGFAAACGAFAYILSVTYIKTAIIISLVTTLLCLAFSLKREILRSFFLILLGSCAGFVWFSLFQLNYLSSVAALDGEERLVTVRASDYSYDTSFGSAFDGKIIVEDNVYQIKVYLNEPKEIQPGNVITGIFRFRITAPDAEEPSLYHQGKGIFLIAYQRSDISVKDAEKTIFDQVAALRRTIKHILQEVFPEDTFPFAQALILGDSSDLSYKTDTDFKLSGIRHVVAVSGLHVSILFALIGTIAFRQRFLMAILGFPGLFFFAALAGFSPSVNRACIMSALMLLAMLAEKEYDGVTALSFAALVMLLLNPLVIASVSFQLSVASVAGIYLFDTPIRSWLNAKMQKKEEGRIISFLRSWFSSSASITLSAMIFTTPLCAVYFGAVSLISPITNLLTLWAISLIFYGILTVCLFFFAFPAGAKLLAAILSLPIRYVLNTAEFMADVPIAAVYTRSPYIAAWLPFVYVLLFLFFLMKKKKTAVFVSCAVLGLCISLLASWSEQMGSDLQFSVLDVGQGQCLLLQYHDTTVLVDCGGDSDTKTADIAAETLLSQGITDLDCMILTHLDRDHAGAAGNFLSRIDSKLLILPPVYNSFAASTDCDVIYVSRPLQLSANTLTIKVIPAEFPGNSNEMSLCILFKTENCDILITGDRNAFGERSLLRNHMIPDVDILVAGHHGAKSSTCEELLQAVQPEIVCISVGKDNTYGHPAPELLQRLQQFNCTVYRTDIHGTIIIRR